ncbi:MAG: CinA domain protein [Acidimicrobiales bacterium]|nr:CinA domain protein [Acidimicrobiales bacterium]
MADGSDHLAGEATDHGPSDAGAPTVEDVRRLAAGLGATVTSSGARVAVAESLTGGLLASELARVEGAGEWFRGGVVAYASDVKYGLLQVRPGPVVSAGAAHDLAVNVARLLDAHIGIAATGIGGPDPEDGVEPGTVWVAVAMADGVCTPELHRFAGDPTAVCRSTIAAALQLAVDHLGT